MIGQGAAAENDWKPFNSKEIKQSFSHFLISLKVQCKEMFNSARECIVRKFFYR